MKKIITLMLIMGLALTTATACGGKDGNDSSVADSSVADSSVADSSVHDSSAAEEESKAEDSSAREEQSKTEDGALDVSALKAVLVPMFEAGETFEFPADAVYNDTGINPETFSEGFWISESTGNSAETVAFYKANSEEEAQEIYNLLSGKLTSLTNQYKDYNADNYAMAQAAKVGVSGVYAYLVISPNVDAICDAVVEALGK